MNQVATTQNAQISQKSNGGMASFLSTPAVKANIDSVIGKENTTRFVTSIVSAVQTNPNLAKCTKPSILNAALLGETLKLSPAPQLGNYYMVPFDNKKKVKNSQTGRDEWLTVSEAQFQIGYKGMLQLAIRSGEYRSINVAEIKEGEVTSVDPITDSVTLLPVMDPIKRESLPVVGYYASFELRNGFKKELYWSKERMEQHAIKYSRGYAADKAKGTAYTFWSKNFDEMAKKTMLRQLISKWGIMSIEMQNAYVADQAVVNSDGSMTYVDNPETTVEATVKEEITVNANSEAFVIDTEDQKAPFSVED